MDKYTVYKLFDTFKTRQSKQPYSFLYFFKDYNVPPTQF